MSRLSAADVKAEMQPELQDLLVQQDFYGLVERIQKYYGNATPMAKSYILALLLNTNLRINDYSKFFEDQDARVFLANCGLRLNTCETLVKFQRFFAAQSADFRNAWYEKWTPLLANTDQDAAPLVQAITQKRMSLALHTQSIVRGPKAAAAEHVSDEEPDADSKQTP